MAAAISIPPEWLVPLGFLVLCLIASWAIFRATAPNRHDDEDG
jgi:hypothetical protein